MIKRSPWKRTFYFLVLCAMPLLTLPLVGLAQGQGAVSIISEGTLKIPFSICTGEEILWTYTLHSVSKEGKDIDGRNFHLNQMSVAGSGLGLDSGNSYVIAGSPCNIVPASGEAIYQCHVSIIGKGGEVAKSIVTGTADGLYVWVSFTQFQCTNPGKPGD